VWEPGPGWRRLSGGSAPSTLGAWLVEEDGRRSVVKRLVAPGPEDPPELKDPADPGWWRREADVALAGAVRRTPGLRGPQPLRVDEDDAGVTLRQAWVPDARPGGLVVARALGAFAGADLPDAGWLARDQLRRRLDRVALRGGWTALARTTVADVADHLWRRRGQHLDSLDALPQVAQHGDPVPANLPGREDEAVLALDWSTLGLGPVGADLGYWALSAREELDLLLDAYAAGLPTGSASREEARHGARVVAVYTVLTRADWALSRVVAGEGALAGKYRHPAVAPHLRALQRQFPQVEALLG
jgi:hypothetical protein